jgi:hypothetical protein
MVEAGQNGKLVISIGSKLPLSQAVEAQAAAKKVISGRSLAPSDWNPP